MPARQRPITQSRTIDLKMFSFFFFSNCATMENDEANNFDDEMYVYAQKDMSCEKTHSFANTLLYECCIISLDISSLAINT